MLTIAYILLSFQLLALATPVDREQNDGNRIWLTKRASTPDSGEVGDVVADIVKLIAQVVFADEYVLLFLIDVGDDANDTAANIVADSKPTKSIQGNLTLYRTDLMDLMDSLATLLVAQQEPTP